MALSDKDINYYILLPIIGLLIIAFIVGFYKYTYMEAEYVESLHSLIPWREHTASEIKDARAIIAEGKNAERKIAEAKNALAAVNAAAANAAAVNAAAVVLNDEAAYGDYQQPLTYKGVTYNNATAIMVDALSTHKSDKKRVKLVKGSKEEIVDGSVQITDKIPDDAVYGVIYLVSEVALTDPIEKTLAFVAYAVNTKTPVTLSNNDIDRVMNAPKTMKTTACRAYVRRSIIPKPSFESYIPSMSVADLQTIVLIVSNR